MGFFDFGSGVISGLLRGKPDLPPFEKLDPQKEQTKAIEGNISALPKATELASNVNQFNQQQIESMLRSSIPLYDQLKSGVSSNIGKMLENDSAMLRGEIPQDVSDAVQNSAAARSLGGGFGGSGMGRNLVARDLGLTSLNLMQNASQGINAAESWMKTAAAIQQPGFFNLTSMFLTPQQQFAMDTQERNAQFQHDWVGNQLNWQNSFGYLMGNEIDKASEQFNSMIGSVVGKVGGMALGGV